MTLTTEEKSARAATRATRKAENAAWEARHAELIAKACAEVAKGVCPQCGRKIARNWALPGWWQCVQFGAVGFRADASAPSCSWQTFTE